MGKPKGKPNPMLKRERLRLGLSQQALARELETTNVSISRWERGIISPSLHFRRLLCKLFNKEAEELFPDRLPTPPLQLVHGNGDADSIDDASPLLQAAEEILQALPQAGQAKSGKQQETQRASQTGQKTDPNAQAETEAQAMDRKHQLLQLRKAEREDEKEEFDHALQLAERIIASVNPDADQIARTELLNFLLPRLLRRRGSGELERIISTPLENKRKRVENQ